MFVGRIDIHLFQTTTVAAKLCLYVQGYFGDPWNVFDFIIVIGSVVDVILSEVDVSKCSFSNPSEIPGHLMQVCRLSCPKEKFPCQQWDLN